MSAPASSRFSLDVENVVFVFSRDDVCARRLTHVPGGRRAVDCTSPCDPGGLGRHERLYGRLELEAGPHGMGVEGR